MELRRRTDGIRRATRGQLDERVVYDEAGLVGALADIASKSATVRSILIAEPIYLVSPCYLSAGHDGLILRGLGKGTGLFMQDPLDDAIQTRDSTPSFSVQTMTVQGINLAPGGTDDWSGVHFTDCTIDGDIAVNTVRDVVFDNCTLTTGRVAAFSDCHSTSIQGSKWRGATAVSDCLRFLVIGNRAVGGITVTTSSEVIISSNVAVGNFDTSASLGRCVVVANHMAGFILTTAGGDVVGLNHP